MNRNDESNSFESGPSLSTEQLSTTGQVNGSEKARRYRYLICTIIFLSYVLVFFHRLCPAVIALEMQEAFEVSGTLLGVLGSAYFYAYAVMQLPTGLLADSWGPRNTVASFLVLAAGGSALMGFAPNLPLAIVGRVLVGLGVSTVFVCNFKLLSQWFEPRKFVIMGGVFLTMGGVGALCSGAPLAWVSNLIGWRMTLVAVGGITLVMAALVYVLVCNRPEDKGWPPVYVGDESEQEATMSLKQGFRQVVRTRPYWAICVWGFFGTGIFFALAGLWGGPYLMHAYGLSKVAAGGVLSMCAVGLIVGGPLLGGLANHLGRKPVLIGCSLLLLAVLGLFCVFPDGLPLALLYVLFFCLSLTGGAAGPVQVALGKELFPVAIAGTAVGVLNLFPFVGGALLQIVIGAVVAHGDLAEGIYSLPGYRYMFLLCAGGALATLVAGFFLQETLPRKKDATNRTGTRVPY